MDGFAGLNYHVPTCQPMEKLKNVKISIKWRVIIGIFSMLIVILQSISAEASYGEYSTVTVLFDGKPLKSDAPAMIIDGRTMVPMRAIFEAFGGTVSWVPQAGLIAAHVPIHNRDRQINMSVGGRSFAYIDHPDGDWQYVDFDSPIVDINGRTMVPVRFISETAGASVEWDSLTNTVSIKTEYYGKYDPELCNVSEISPVPCIQSDNPEVMALARKITENAGTDMGKARAVHDWVAQNIEYGFVSAAGVNALEVLHRKKSICIGYSYLTAALLRSVGLPCRVIDGSADGGAHSWNEVLVDGRWVVIDTTWDAGEVDYDNNTFIKNFSTEYFDPDPEYFNKTHNRERVLPAYFNAGL